MRPAAATLFLTLRGAFVALCVLSSAYCLMAYLPFTYQQVIDFKVVPGTSGFALLHPWLYWFAFIAAAWTLAEDYRPGTRALLVGFLASGTAGGVLLVIHPQLVNIRNENASLVWAAVWLVPLWWVAMIDLVGTARFLRWGREDSGEDVRWFAACATTGVAAAAVYAGIQWTRGDVTPGSFTAQISAGIVLWSVWLHLLAFLAGFTVLVLLRGLAGLVRPRAAAEFVLGGVLTAAIAVGVIRTYIFPAVSFSGSEATLMAWAYACTLVVTVAGLAVRICPEQDVVVSGLGLGMSPFSLPHGTPRALRVVLLCLWVGLTWVLATSTPGFDWNYLVQTLAALVMWVVGLAWFYAVLPQGPPATSRRVAVLLAVPLILLAGYRVMATAPALLSPLGLPADGRMTRLDRYAGYDVSFRVLHNLVRVEPGNVEAVGAASAGGSAPVDMAQFFGFLQRNTNIPRSVKIDVPELQMVPAISPHAARAPHIFIIVIDSLRQDYLSPYNHAVTFTPAVDRFAKDAGTTVFRKAFTRYGATGLSEPSIWTGAMVPHQQYPPSLGRANTLQRLLMAEGYQPYVSVDVPLQSALAPWPGLTELDKGISNKDYDVARSLDELEGRLRGRAVGDQTPVFAYTQPQNIHISAIAREGKSVPAGESYPGFYAPYAARLRRVDEAFGRFVETLRQLNLYDDSVVILTSDHGDSLGEEGRFGHAYTIYPEILRVPLLVHLPTWWRQMTVDPDAVAMLTDITPSLYYLLGQRPVVNDPLFGRPLFTEQAGERAVYRRESIAVGSSYGPVYGALAGDGSSLYIADATNYREYSYDLTNGFAGTTRTVTPQSRAAAVGLIRDAIQRVARTYRIPIS